MKNMYRKEEYSTFYVYFGFDKTLLLLKLIFYLSRLGGHFCGKDKPFFVN